MNRQGPVTLSSENVQILPLTTINFVFWNTKYLFFNREETPENKNKE